jgi:hypothetical protein
MYEDVMKQIRVQNEKIKNLKLIQLNIEKDDQNRQVNDDHN